MSWFYFKTYFLGITYTIMAQVTKHYVLAFFQLAQTTSKAGSRGACVQSV